MLVQTKDQILEDAFDRVCRLVDAQGQRIDSGIIAVVMYLQMHGVRTVSSCEGHLDHGQHYPWVMCPADEQSRLSALTAQFGDSLVIDGEMVEDRCILRPRVRQAKQLHANQQEMMQFAEFLRDLFFEGEH